MGAREHDARAALGALLFTLSCQAVLGIEDLSAGARPAEGGGAGGGTASAPPALVPSGGNAGSMPAAAGGSPPASPGGSGGLATAGAGGSGLSGVAAPDAGLPQPPDASAGESAPGTLAVSGRVIDFFRRPVPNAPVSIGERTTSTDADGRFSITAVASPYDVYVSVAMQRFGVPARYGYVYEGLTRADPTLQVYSALTQRAVTQLDVTFDVPGYEQDASRGLILAVGSADTDFADTDLGNGTTSILGGLAWSGPASIAGTAHALLVRRPGGLDGAPPFAYEAHQSTALTATDEAISQLRLQLVPGALPQSTISGTVRGATLGSREDFVALRFNDGTALPLLEAAAGEGFSYVVPALPDSSLVLAAAQGFDAPHSLAWREGIAPGEAGIQLDLPAPPVPVAPQSNATITPATLFSWSSAEARAFLWHVELIDDFSYQGLFVATTRTELPLPRLPDSFGVPLGFGAVWSVETHGDFADVDAMTGPEGFLDAYSVPPQSRPIGPARGGGTFTESARSFFTMGSD